MSSSDDSISALLKTLTNDKRKQCSLTILDVPVEVLRKAKVALKATPHSADQLFRCMLVDMECKGGPGRIKLFKLSDYVLYRSERFRSLFLTDIKEIVRRSGVNGKIGGTAPKTHQKELQSLVLRFLAFWDADYGVSFPPLRALVRFMRESLSLSVPDIVAERRASQEEADSRLLESVSLIRVKVRQVFGEMDSSWDEITGNLDRLEESFRLMFPDIADGTAHSTPHSHDASHFAEEISFPDGKR